ncbi:MAG: biotin/lipoyl-containing protein [Elusimicrobiota bacterium]
MNYDELKEFLEAVKGTDIEELNVESGESKVFFRRNDVPVIKAKPAAAGNGADAANGDASKEKRLIPIKSTMVGTYFHADSPDRPPFVIVGNHVVPGQKVGIIEAMKIMKEMTSNVKGRIVKVLIDNGHPVEYGQELFLVDTETENGSR